MAPARTIAFACVALLCAITPAEAQTAAPGDAAPVAIATRVDEPPVVDGDVLGDPGWSKATPVDGFWQTTPDDGQPSSQRTEVRVVYTSTALYFGVVCYDTQPGSIIVADSRRDSPLTETDSFQIILDTYRDGQNGFVFGTNPAGVEYDGQVAREGAESGGGGGGGRQQAGSGGGFNINWDGAWEVRTRVSEIGWSAEFEIPFRTLRYSPGQTSWSVNFQRNIRRRNERAFWARLQRQHDLFRLVDAGTLAGLTVPSQRNLKLSPYVLGQSLDERGPGGNDRSRGTLGGDLKYSLTPSLTLDLTVNTDFAQVEVDEEQINLDRFNLFFPEKRPFFLENAGLFSVGRPGEVEIFFSRRIGIGGTGEVIPIRGGGRLTGRVGGVNVGLLNMQTAEEPLIAPGNNFTVARVSRDFRNRSSLGGMLVNRTATDSFAGSPGFNRTAAMDGRLGVGRYGLLNGFAARTATPGVDGDEYAYGLGARYESEAWRLTADYTEVSDAFNPEVGFLSRRGYRNPEVLAFHTRRLGDNRWKLLEIRPHVSYRGFWSFAGFQETGHLHMDSHWQWRSANEVHTGVNVTRQGVTTPFEIFPGIFVPAGTYDHKELQLVGNTNRGAPISVDSRVVAGGFFGGNRLSTTTGATARLGETFNTNVSWQRNDVDLPWGNFVTNLLRTRLSYSFSPRIYVQALLQYNDRADIWSTNLRFGWLQASNTGLFIVLNDTVDLDDVPTRRTGRTLTLKYSRLFDLLR